MPAPLLSVQFTLIFVSKFLCCLRQKTQSFPSKNMFRFFFSHLMLKYNCIQDVLLIQSFLLSFFGGQLLNLRGACCCHSGGVRGTWSQPRLALSVLGPCHPCDCPRRIPGEGSSGAFPHGARAECGLVSASTLCRSSGDALSPFSSRLF